MLSVKSFFYVVYNTTEVVQFFLETCRADCRVLILYLIIKYIFFFILMNYFRTKHDV